MHAKRELMRELRSLGKTMADIAAIKIIYKGRVMLEATEVNARKMARLNFEYNDNFGWQELYGIVLFKDGTWLERYEYDGAESWVHKKPITVEDVLAFYEGIDESSCSL